MVDTPSVDPAKYHSISWIRFTNNSPLVPPFSTIRRASRWIALISLSIVTIWCWWILTNGAPHKANATRGSAIEAFEHKRFFDTYKLYNQLRAQVDTSDSLAIHFREQATAIGKAGDDSTIAPETAYTEYVRLQRQAFDVADNLGNDSIKEEAAVSAENMIRYCKEQGLNCSPNPASEEGPNALSTVAKPLSFGAVVLIAIAVILLLYPRSRGT